MKRLIALVAAALVATTLPAMLASAPAAAVTKVTPRMVLTVTPRYPQQGQVAHLTGVVGGRYGRAGGWVRFRFDGHIITGCRRVTLHHGVAHCTAPRSFSAVRHFALGFFGSPHYRARWVFRTVYS